MSSHNKVTLVLVVNGVEAVVDANVHAPLRTVAERALAETGNMGRPLGDWELKDERGRPLPLDRKVGEFGFGERTVLYLTLTVGVNGIRRTATRTAAVRLAA
jgi:hypothetical protein